MSLLTSARRAIPAAVLFATYTLAQQCYFPSGIISSDKPCLSGQASGCCASESYCLSGGFCLTGGVVTRGSCTVKSWGTPNCAGFCQSENADGEVAITPCSTGVSTNTFVCGLDSRQCTNESATFTLSTNLGVILNPAQQAALLKQALSESGQATGSSDGLSSGQAAGLGLGIAIPLLIALAVAIYLLIKEKRFGKRRSMIRLPDDNDKECTPSAYAPQPQPPPTVVAEIERGLSRASGRRSEASNNSRRSENRRSDALSPRPLQLITPAFANSSTNLSALSPAQSPALTPRPSLAADGSRSPTVATHHAGNPQRPLLSHNFAESPRIPSQVASFAERFETAKPELVMISRHASDKTSSPRHELDSSPVATPRDGGAERYELAAKRMSAE